MPAESKSETPRNEQLRVQVRLGQTDIYEILNHHAALEKELNEANLKCARERRISLAQSNLAIKAIEERNTLAKELADAKEIINIERQHREVNNEVQLAKENKVMREALKQSLKAIKLNFPVGLDITREDIIDLIESVLESSNPANPIVLTRNELIAELEKMPCGCNFTWQGVPGNLEALKVVAGDKCHRCQCLARVKGRK